MTPPMSPVTTTARSEGHLQQFFRWVLPVTFSFALLGGLGSVLFHDRGIGLTAAILFVYGCVLRLAQAELHGGRIARTIVLICLGLLASTVAVALAQPAWLPPLIVTPLLAVAVALPHASAHVVRRLIFASWAVAVTVTLVGESHTVPTALPSWFGSAFRVGSLAAAFATVLLLLSQFSSRLTETLAKTRAAEERYALAAQGANDGLWDWDLTTNRIYFSPRWKAMLGATEDEMDSDPEEWFGRLHRGDRKRVEAQLADHLAGRTPHFESEHRLRHKDGEYRWMLSRGLVVRNGNGEATRLAGSQTDITTRKQIEEQLLHAAFHDTLTNLPNRALFMDRLAQAMDRSRYFENYHFGVLFLDLDRFKVLNDSLGHTVGDQLLVAVAHRLQACLRPSDTVARLGGDEFTVLLPNLKRTDEVLDIAERILAELSAPFELESCEVFVTVSIGIVTSASGYTQPDEFLRDADIALYRAKSLGKARYAVFDQTMHQYALARLQLETDLRRALEREELTVVYQPIVSLKSGRITGFEALVRWRHPHQGFIPPDQFIPMAEETGLIIPLSWWILREACLQLRRWHEMVAAPLTMNVNWPGYLFAQPNMVDQVVAILHEAGIDPRQLQLEITESVITEETSTIAAVLSHLRTLDIQLQIDDFGTGYSSLSTLHTLPINALKIDRAFVGRLGLDRDTMEIVQAIVTLAHHLGMNVIAEGIETAPQLAELRTLGCDYGQGFLFSEAVGAEKASHLLVAEPEW